MGQDAMGPTVLHELQEPVHPVKVGRWREKDEEGDTRRTVSHGPKPSTPIAFLEVPDERCSPGWKGCGGKGPWMLQRFHPTVWGEKSKKPMIRDRGFHFDLRRRDCWSDRKSNGELSASYQRRLLLPVSGTAREGVIGLSQPGYGVRF
jgi:hypothetical protein